MNFLESIWQDKITMTFAVIILVSCVLLHARFDRFSATHGGEILTTMGILGCFLGIAVALTHFDSNNISESVPELLNGVKTAFWASVTGVITALSIKIRDRFWGIKEIKQEASVQEASLADVVNCINLLRKTISGDSDSSLTSQIKLLRSDQNEKSNLMIQSLNDFAEKVAKIGSEQLIDALRQVITDFNANLTEQFGENFKQLNAAVLHLVTWQQQYKDELDQLKGVQSQAANDMRICADAFTSMAGQSQAYIDSAVALQDLMQAFEQRYSELVRTQQALVSVLAQMKQAEPALSAKLNDMSEAFTVGIANVSTRVGESVKELGSALSNHTAMLNDLLKDIIPSIQTKINQELSNSNSQLTQNFESLRTNLESELTKTLDTLGRQLASLSEKFVTDYTPLTEKLQMLVETARRVE